ncbi:MAG: hypothetical protein LBR95_09175 [Azoarcus sp.]|jgi:hypothetical protein|nr:hypothetical protein [Azoarcus sp.]
MSEQLFRPEVLKGRNSHSLGSVYRARWEIELFFLILKEGCRIEALQLGEIKRHRV